MVKDKRNELYVLLNNSIKKFKPIVDKRIKEFERIGVSSAYRIYKELCFCILTANFSAKGGIRIQKSINDGFIFLNEKELSNELRKLGHRFPNTRAKYIIEARYIIPKLKDILSMEEQEAREFLVRNVKGLGYKESSHFLRNCGMKNLAIIDFHIIDLLSRYKVIGDIKKGSLNKKNYLHIEKKLIEISKRFNLTLAELDLYLWAIETGEVLK